MIPPMYLDVIFHISRRKKQKKNGYVVSRERPKKERKIYKRGQRSRYPEEMSSEMSQARSAVGSRPKATRLLTISKNFFKTCRQLLLSKKNFLPPVWVRAEDAQRSVKLIHQLCQAGGGRQQQQQPKKIHVKG
jgi:hypothetical protein